MIKNILIGTVLVLVMIASAGATEVRVDPASQTVAAGDPFHVNITVEDVVNMKGDAAALNFDPSAMQVTGITEGDFLKTGGTTIPIASWNNTAGTALFGYSLGFGTWTAVSGNGTLATINFSTYPGAPADTYDLILTDVVIRDENNTIIPRDVFDGNVTIAGGPVLCTDPDPPAHDFGDVPEGQVRTWTFDITNCGTGILTWNVNDNQPWIGVNPTSGTTTTETDTVTVTIDTTGLSMGLHTGTINVTSNGGDKGWIITVNVVAAPIPVRVDPASQTVAAGDPFHVNITVEDVVNMKGDAAALNFDPSAMQVTGITEGDFLKTGGNTLPIASWDNTAGTAMFAYTLMGGTPVSGSGTLATINFSTYPDAPTGVYNMGLTNVEIRDKNNDLIPADVVDGNVTIGGGAVLSTALDPLLPDFGDVPEGQVRTGTFGITNNGTGTLTWNVSGNQPWIGVNPTSGTTTTETDTVTVTIDTTGLSPGLHTGTINVTSNGGNKEWIITVNVVAAPIPTPPPVPVPVLSGIGMIALIAALAVVLAISVSSATRRRKK